MLKNLARTVTPTRVRTYIRDVRRHLQHRRDRTLTLEEVFTNIYSESAWGGEPGTFNSGTGTADESVVLPYLRAVVHELQSQGLTNGDFVDLGCGDFRVGSQLRDYASTYTAVDVVRPLIDENRRRYSDAHNVTFVHRDIVEADLPPGDVCFIRQVLQHLSNQQISLIIGKLRQYQVVFVTEHHPLDADSAVPNLDKEHGGDVRAYERSGVFLTEPPFNIPREQIKMILEVRGTRFTDHVDPGVIRTYIWRPAA